MIDTNTFNYSTDSNLNLFYDRTKEIAETLIITVPDNKKSIGCAERAIRHCLLVNQPNPRIFWGYDGTDRKTIKTPEHLKDSTAMQLLKVMDTNLVISEVACFLSHIAAWVHCVKINKPVVILEHDSIMLRPFNKINFSNCLEYLGHVADLANELGMKNADSLKHYLAGNYYENRIHRKYLDIPLTQFVNANYLLILGLHNYAIDPIMAKKLVSYVIHYGIVNPADAIIEQHEFTIVQTGTYAVQGIDSEETSVITAKGLGRKYTHMIPGVELC